MKSLTRELQNRLKSAQRIAVLGVGSPLRGDDSAGLLTAALLGKRIRGAKRLKVFLGGDAPENMTGPIKKFKPSHLLVIDCVDSGKNPGELCLFPDFNAANPSFSTHRLPLQLITSYISGETGCNSLLIGIQPDQSRCGFGKSVCEPVCRSIKRLAQLLEKVISK